MLKNNLSFLLLGITGLILALCFCSCQKRQISNIDSNGKNIICFGDSLTFGYGAEEKDSYPIVLSSTLVMNVINAGKSGDTVEDALNRLEKDVLEKEPLLVIVILGANDFLQGIPKQKTFAGLQDIVRRIKAKGAMVALGQIGPFSMYSYNEEYKKLAQSENTLLINSVLKGIFGNPELMNDSVHPNAKGYKKMADKIYKAINPIIEQNRRLRGTL